MNPNIKPPKLADALFRWYSERARIEDLRGDLEELFHQDVQHSTPFQAKVNYWKRVFSLIFSYAITRRKHNASYHHFSYTQLNASMFKNYFKTATRNLAKNKFFTVLNVFGLALGMSISLIFIAMLSFIYRYDNFHSNKDRIYRVITHVRDNMSNPSYASAPVGLAHKLKNDFAGIESITRINANHYGYTEYGEKRIPMDANFADPEFLTMFNFPLLKGDRNSSLVKPNSIVLTITLADKIFGSEDPMGKMINMEPYGELMVTGVMQDVPKNSHITFEAIVSYATLLSYNGPSFAEREENWQDFTNSYVYMLLPERTNPASIQQFLDQLAEKKYSTGDFKASFELQNLNDIVPGPTLYNNIGPNWDYLGMILMGSIFMIILIPACMNYVNLAISQSLRRMKEIGVRKVMGGQRKQIFFQFITETTITMLLALLISYLFFELMRAEALKIMESGEIMDFTPTPITYLGFILFALFIGFLAGIVPAAYFAKIAPLNALKDKEARIGKRGGFPVRKVMITLQFILSLGFIIAVVVAKEQYNYSVNYDFGFNQENMLDVELQGVDAQLVKNEFEKLSAVQAVSMSSHVMGLGYYSDQYVRKPDQADSLNAGTMSVDEGFISNFKLKLLHGKNFTANLNESSKAIIINEELAKKLNADDPFAAVNQLLILPGKKEVRIAGIVQNFHYAGLRDSIASFYFHYDPENFNIANVRFPTKEAARELPKLESQWKTIAGETKLKAQFLSDEITDSFDFYIEMIKLWSFLGILAITVACLGMLGTVVFTIRNRVKEISLRKVMGASSESLVILLSKDFIILMIIACMITIPVMDFGFEHILLTTQSYSVSVRPVDVIISVMILFVLGMAAILSQTLRAANTNPVDNLRVE